MELRRLSVCIAFFMLAVISQCSEARHSVHRRASDYEVSDEMMNDESRDYGFQNDADGGNEADEEESQPDGVILSKGENYSMIIGMSVRLECRVTPADGSLVVSWNKGDRAIFLGRMPQGDRLERVSLDKHSSDLIIKDLKISDTGLYTCKIMQANPVNITHSVIVEELPIIRSFNATSTVLREGDDLFISCDVSGNPEPEVRLTRVTKSGPGSGSAERLVPSDHTFSKKNISKDDAGVYYCYAISGTNSVVKEMTIDVLVKPRVHVARPQVNTDIDVEAQLQCATHEDTAHIRWYKDGQLIEDASTQYTISTNGPQSTLSVTPRRDEDFGTYTCEAENAHSRHSKSIDLIQTPIIENYDVQGPNLSWTVHSHQPLEEIEVLLKPSGEDGEWKSFQVPLPEEKTHVYEIVYPLNDKSLENGSYMANVKVKNNKGWSQHSEPVEVTLKEDQPQPIQTASVYRDGATDGAHSIRPATFAALSTLMCLLVRML